MVKLNKMAIHTQYAPRNWLNKKWEGGKKAPPNVTSVVKVNSHFDPLYLLSLSYEYHSQEANRALIVSLYKHQEYKKTGQTDTIIHQ